MKLRKNDVSEDSKFSILPQDLKKLKILSEDIFISTFKKNKDKINKENLFLEDQFMLIEIFLKIVY